MFFYIAVELVEPLSRSLMGSLRALAKDINFTHLNVFAEDEDYFLVEMARQTLPFLKQVEQLKSHRAMMKAQKVGIYQPLMWQEEKYGAQTC